MSLTQEQINAIQSEMARQGPTDQAGRDITSYNIPQNLIGANSPFSVNVHKYGDNQTDYVYPDITNNVDSNGKPINQVPVYNYVGNFGPDDQRFQRSTGGISPDTLAKIAATVITGGLASGMIPGAMAAGSGASAAATGAGTGAFELGGVLGGVEGAGGATGLASTFGLGDAALGGTLAGLPSGVSTMPASASSMPSFSQIKGGLDTANKAMGLGKALFGNGSSANGQNMPGGQSGQHMLSPIDVNYGNGQVFHNYNGDVSKIPLQGGIGEHTWFTNNNQVPQMKQGGLACYADGGLFDAFTSDDEPSNFDGRLDFLDDGNQNSNEWAKLLRQNDTTDGSLLNTNLSTATPYSGLGGFADGLKDFDQKSWLKLLTGAGLVNSLMNHQKQQTLQEQVNQLKGAANSWTPSQQATADQYFNSAPKTIQPYKGNASRAPIVGGEHVWFHADGGLAGNGEPMQAQGALHQMMRGPGLVRGNGGGQDDVVNAMLAPGEYVMDAESVSHLGDGDTHAGAAQLDNMREAIRAHRRSASNKSIPPKAKQPMKYLGDE